jgi:hypothetical protein
LRLHWRAQKSCSTCTNSDQNMFTWISIRLCTCARCLEHSATLRVWNVQLHKGNDSGQKQQERNEAQCKKLNKNID